MRIALALTLLLAVSCLAEQSVVDMNFYEAYLARQGETLLHSARKSAKNREKAYETYSNLAANTSDSELATLAKARAAVALGLQEGKYEQGLERARAVADRAFSVQAQMQLMVANKDYQKLLDEFATEDIPAWPKRTLPAFWNYGNQDLRARALADRAQAYLETGNTAAAVADAEKALEFAEAKKHKLGILDFLARKVYERKLRDVDKTFEIDMKIIELDAGQSGTLQARIQAGAYLLGKKRYDEALAALGPGWSKVKSRHWFSRGMKAVADTLAAAGRYGEAADAYRIMAEADGKRLSEKDRIWAAGQMKLMRTKAAEKGDKGGKWNDAEPDKTDHDAADDLE